MWRWLGGLTVCAGAAVLAGWASDVPTLKSLIPGGLVIKANTALCFVLIGAGFLLLSAARSPAVSRLARCCGALAGLGGLFTLVEFVSGWNPGFDQWLFQELIGAAATSHPGRMAPDTALGFVLLAAALQLAHRPRRSRRAVAGMAVVGALVIALALAALVIHFASTHRAVGYWGFTLMAPATSLIFAVLGVAAVLMAGLETGPRVGSMPRPLGTPESRAGLSFLLAFLVLSAGILATGALFYQVLAEHHHAEVERNLAAIADLKVGSVQRWRQERWMVAEWIRNSPYGARRALDAMAQPASSSTRRMFTGWLDPLLANAAYERVLLVDEGLNARLAHPQGPLRVLTETERATAQQALLSRQVVVGDLHRTPDDDGVRLDFMIPLIVRREGTNDNVPAAGLGPAPADRSAAVLILEVNARDFLFPLIQTWPTPSPTAETLLVRQEGDEVVYLNELRHRKGTALNLRRPLEETHLPAARGLRGERGVMEGLDYRGAPVMAAVRAVPNSPWVMVAKVDLEEVNAPLRQQALIMGAVVLAMFLAASFGVALLWRRHNERLLQAHLAADRERLALARRVEHLMRGAHDIILLSDEHQKIVEANDRAVESYGYTREELLRLRLENLRPPAERPALAALLQRVAAEDGVVFEATHLRKDGTTFPVEGSARHVEIEGRRFNLGIIRDVTLRKAQEAEIKRLTRLYATLSQVNQTIVRCQSRQELVADICRVAVEFGEFKAAWIGWKDPATQRLTTAAHRAAPPETDLLMPGWSGGCGIAGEVLRTGQPCLCHNAQGDERSACCRETLKALGVQSCAAFPLWLRGEVFGVLSICSIEPGFLNREEIRLLEEVSSDVSFALDRLDKEARRQEAEAALREQAESLRARNEELERWQRASVGRELRMIELKGEVNELCRRLGEPVRYQTDTGPAEIP